MYTNSFQKPDSKFLTKKSHNLISLINSCVEIVNKHDISMPSLNESHHAYDLFNFLSSYATKNRYQNLNKLTNAYKEYDNHPIHEWFNISSDYLRRNEKNEKIEIELLKHYDKFPHTAGYTHYLDFDNHPLLSVDLLMYQFVVKRAKHFILNDLIQTLKPIYRMLDKISLACNNNPDSDLNCPVKLPYFGELFQFFYADLEQFKRVKKWTNRYG